MLGKSTVWFGLLVIKVVELELDTDQTKRNVHLAKNIVVFVIT